MSITKINDWETSATNNTNLAISLATLGNCVLLVVQTVSATINASTVSGGGCTNWTRIAGPFQDTFGTVCTWELWLGSPVTATGSQTVSLTFTGTVTSITIKLMAYEFSASLGASTVWTLDGSQAGHRNNTSSVTITWPTLTAVGTGELYFGSARVENSASAGGTSGFTYQNDDVGNTECWNGTFSGTVGPTCPQAPVGVSHTIAALVTAGMWHALAATGLAATSGSAALSINVVLAATGLAATSGSAALNATIVLAATGLAATAGSAALSVNVTLSATGLAATTGTMDLVVRRVLASDALAATTGTMSMTMKWSLAATCLAATSGSMNFGLPVPMAAAGLAATTGSFAFASATPFTPGPTKISLGATGWPTKAAI